MILLYRPIGAWGVASVSPFCVKLETWLRMAGLAYEAREANPLKAPKGKVPYIELEGRMMGDSQLILEHLAERFGVTMDAGLDPEARARGHVIRRMLEEGTYWVLAHDRWIAEAGWAVYRPVFLAMMPPVIGGAIVASLRRTVRQNLHAQGTGRHLPAEIDRIGVGDVDALATLLGERPYVCGETPSSADAAVYAFLASIVAFPAESATRSAVLGHPSLVAYHARMTERYWPSPS